MSIFHILTAETRAAHAVKHAMAARADGSALRCILRAKRFRGEVEYRRTIRALRVALDEQKARRAERVNS